MKFYSKLHESISLGTMKTIHLEDSQLKMQNLKIGQKRMVRWPALLQMTMALLVTTEKLRQNVGVLLTLEQLITLRSTPMKMLLIAAPLVGYPT